MMRYCMKYILPLPFLLALSIVVFGQQTPLQTWNEEAKTNIRLLPKYGYREKSPAQQQADREFMDEMMRQPSFNNNPAAASRAMIEKGFEYLSQGDLRTAMYRFNQAYLLDSLNVEIYRGYAAVYEALGDRERTRQYKDEYLAKSRPCL